MANRSLKETPVPVIVFYHSILGFIILWILIAIEAAITGELRLTQYSSMMWLQAYGAAFFDTGSMITTIVAFQRDRASFSSLLSYMNIVYSYICDVVIFDENLHTLELIAAFVIMITALGVAFYKLKLRCLRCIAGPKSAKNE